MLHKTVKIEIDYKKLGLQHDDYEATITTYILDNYPQMQGIRKRPLIVICPGGGYEHLSPREAEAIAIKMNSFGFHACILRYSLSPNNFPCALYEAAYTMNYVRKHADEWSADSNKIILGGFSAGGHVAASLGTLWNKDILSSYLKEELHVEPKDIRPDGLLLGYPVISSGIFAHRPSFERLLGKQQEQYLEYTSLENRVDEQTPVTFLWHTFADQTVPVENSLLFADSLRKKEVPFELHIFPNGSHGLGLATKETDMKDGSKSQPECACWVTMFQTWVETNL